MIAALSVADGRGPKRVERVEIERDGRWSSAEGSFPPREALARLSTIDACFLGLHGGLGEDGHVQGFLELSGLFYTGSGLRGAALSMDKWAARLLVAQKGIAVPSAVLIRREDFDAGEIDDVVQLVESSAAGVCVKPRSGGSSVDTTRARSWSEVEPAAVKILEGGEEVLVESWTEGIELTCAVLGNRGERLRTLPPVEIRPHAGRFFDYEEKYSSSGARELCPPESVDPAICSRVRELALAAHRELSCDGYSRTDFIVPGETAEPVFLETNALPGLTPRSLLPLAAASAGMDFRSLCLEILRLGLTRKRN